MEFTFAFIEVFAIALYYLSPLLLFLLFLMTILGYFVGRTENWSVVDSLYYTFITATTVGYGDFHPLAHRSKLFAIIIALLGLLCTGLIVAAGLKAAEVAFTNSYEIDQVVYRLKSQ